MYNIILLRYAKKQRILRMQKMNNLNMEVLMSEKFYKTILFDLDGTLTDPKEGITKSVKYALDAFGVDDVRLDDLIKFIGPPLTDAFIEFYGFSEEEAKQLLAKYRERFAVKGIFENRLYDGIKSLLRDVKKQGKIIALATSKPTVYAEQILEHYDIMEYFDVIVGSYLDGRRTKKSDVIQGVIDTLDDKETAKMLMVGDRKHDVEGAANHGIDCAGVVFGYGGREELKEAGATYIVNTVDELRRLIL